ncbi:MAG: hypothetical protein H7301_07660 [Cryobacterium sp.]|nr:hypothetical protein [Oligoflexia bacterium]
MKKLKLPNLIGTIQLSALPGSPGSRDLHPTDAVRIAGLRAVKEARELKKAGFKALMLENTGDTPYFERSVSPETLASFAFIAAAVREAVSVPLGIRVLRNDSRAALAIAAVTGLEFIRVRGLMTTGAELLRERDRLGAEVAILADLSNDPRSFLRESGADGVIIPVGIAAETVAALRAANAKTKLPVWVADGVRDSFAREIQSMGFGALIESNHRAVAKAFKK